MSLEGENRLFAWIASTWLPYIQQIPQELKEDYINETMIFFVRSKPPDKKG
jgi:hypothetical protein